MDASVIQGLIKPELAAVVAVCWIIGFGLKHTPKVADWMLIYGVTTVGIVFTCFSLGWNVDSVIQGILCGALAVYGNQLFKQTVQALKKEDRDG
ncbi:phage holin family protein [Paenibacillus pasadenensis]|uniref:phage holin family protein n=1 Tax=Paenibacillus pasadenensis TaxID=217090 RepID=UPI00203B085D|nr:phage holin family protein [Paenibacillus pasadenensis]MCM3748018.1 phage holin family protein [Paenibacillus pasadenensis]